MKKEAHRAHVSALQVRSLWGRTTSTAWTLSYTICMWFFFPWWVSPTVSSHEVKTFKFGVMLARAVFPYWLVDGQNPSSQAPTHGLMGYKLWSWNSASVRDPEWWEPTTWIRSVSLSGSLYIPHLSVFSHCSYRLCIYIITYLFKTECASYFSLYQHIYSVFAITDTVY